MHYTCYITFSSQQPCKFGINSILQETEGKFFLGHTASGWIQYSEAMNVTDMGTQSWEH